MARDCSCKSLQMELVLFDGKKLKIKGKVENDMFHWILLEKILIFNMEDQLIKQVFTQDFVEKKTLIFKMEDQLIKQVFTLQ